MNQIGTTAESEEVGEQSTGISLIGVAMTTIGGGMLGSSLMTFATSGIQTFAIDVGAILMVGGLLYIKIDTVQKRIEKLGA